MAIEDDFDTWDYWWEFNKNPFLHLRSSLQEVPQTGSDDFYLGATARKVGRDSLRPTEQQLVGEILPALHKAMESTGQRDIQTACLVAMAKVGLDHPDFQLVDVFAPRLRSVEQEVRETAALALGIAGRADARSLDLQCGLVLDDAAARAASGGAVDERTRAFAAYGLGLTARRASAAVKARALSTLSQILGDDRPASRNLKVAAIQAIGLLQIDARSYEGARLRESALAALEAYYRRPLGAGDQLIQAHCPTAITKLIGPDEARSDTFKDLFAGELSGSRERHRNNALAQSCALALGNIVRPNDGPGSADLAYSQLLLEVSRSHPNVATRNFALMALAQIGGNGNRIALLEEFDRGNSMRRPWCALALGVLACRERQQPDAPVDDFVVATLHDALLQAKEPGLVGALGVALGLAHGTDAADCMRARMLDNLQKEPMAGYLCIGLALMDDRNSIPDVRQVTLQATRRPLLLVQAAIALGRLGDRRIAEDLVGLMTAGEPSLVKLGSLSSALGFIGDRRSVAPLLRLLLDDRVSALPRAFAAAALGGIADRRPLPWSTPISVGVNYRANVETLTDQVAGVLDIL